MLATFQVLSGHMWLVPTVLNSGDKNISIIIESSTGQFWDQWWG